MRDELGAARRLVGQNVKRVRELRRLTQEGLAERSDLSLPFLVKIEAGRANPTVNTLARICAALSAEMSELTRSPERKASVAKQVLRDLAEESAILTTRIRRLERDL